MHDHDTYNIIKKLRKDLVFSKIHFIYCINRTLKTHEREVSLIYGETIPDISNCVIQMWSTVAKWWFKTINKHKFEPCGNRMMMMMMMMMMMPKTAQLYSPVILRALCSSMITRGCYVTDQDVSEGQQKITSAVWKVKYQYHNTR